MRILRTLPLLALIFAAPALRAQTQQGQTVICSDTLDMQAGESVNNFLFAGNVSASTQGLALFCDRLYVVALRKAGSTGTVGKMGGVDSVIAEGNVRIEQSGRIAHAGRAEVRPAEGLVILSDKPRIEDVNGTIEGWQIIYNSAERTVKIVSDPSAPPRAGRTRVTLSENAIPKLDYEQAPAPEGDAPQTPAAPEGQ